MTKDYGYQLPLEIDPSEKVCFQIYVPNDLYHIAAFKGQIWELTRWFNWAKDEAHTALLVADVWKDIYEQVRASEGCAMPTYLEDVRQNTSNPCTLEKTIDGATWTSFANLLLCQPKLRYNGGLLQWFNPVTGMWETASSGDERFDGSAPPPWPSGTVPVGESGACLAAENIAAVWQSSLTELKSGLTIGRDVLALTTGLAGTMSIFIPQTLIAAVAQAIVLVVVQGGISFIDSLLTHVNDLKCTVSCNIESDGSVTASDYDAIYAGVADWSSGLELEVIQAWLGGFGSVGLTRQGKAAGITTGDCDDCLCNWIKEFDFTTGQHGWDAVDFNGSTTVYVAGVGFVATGNGVEGISIIDTMGLDVASDSIRGCEVTYGASGYPSGSNAVSAFAWNDASGTNGIAVSATIDPDALPTTQSISPSGSMTHIYVRTQINVNGTTVATGSVTTTKIRLSGVYPEPTWP